MGKQRPQFDSARQIGPEIQLHEILMVVVGCGTEGKERMGGIFHPQKSKTFWLVAKQPEELSTNGDHSWIQRVRKVQKYPSMEFSL